MIDPIVIDTLKRMEFEHLYELARGGTLSELHGGTLKELIDALFAEMDRRNALPEG